MAPGARLRLLFSLITWDYPRFFAGFAINPRRSWDSLEEERACSLRIFARSKLSFSMFSLTRFFARLFMNKLYNVNYRGGERYPHLERDTTKPDLLSELIKAHAPS